jgi:hypothetical protein
MMIIDAFDELTITLTFMCLVTSIFIYMEIGMIIDQWIGNVRCNVRL